MPEGKLELKHLLQEGNKLCKLSLILRPPRFLFFSFGAKNEEGLGTPGGRKVDVSGALPINQLACNKR